MGVAAAGLIHALRLHRGALEDGAARCGVVHGELGRALDREAVAFDRAKQVRSMQAPIRPYLSPYLIWSSTAPSRWGGGGDPREGVSGRVAREWAHLTAHCHCCHCWFQALLVAAGRTRAGLGEVDTALQQRAAAVDGKGLPGQGGALKAGTRRRAPGDGTGSVGARRAAGAGREEGPAARPEWTF